MMHTLLTTESKCCGCGVCALECPADAIEMVPGELGSLYPKVDTQKCIDCQKCVKSCAYQTQRESEHVPLQAFAAVAADKKLLRKSASGGVFATLAGAILDAGGAVFGCAMEEDGGVLTPRHICIESRKDLVKLQGSKYVQSELGDTFTKIKQQLLQGRTVLFSGTPCQVDALKKYTQGVCSGKLYTIDLICHGVPSIKLFQDYLAQLCKRPMTEFYFRDKTFGWGLTAKYAYTNKKGMKKEALLPSDVSSYYSYFLSSETYRQSCYTCRYTNLSRVGDITIGDFWGVEREHPGFEQDVSEGVSAILVNTPEGSQLLENYGQTLCLKETTPDRVAKWNKQLRAPSAHTALRQEIAEQYEKNGYAGVEAQFRNKLGLRYCIKKLKYTCKKWVRKLGI